MAGLFGKTRRSILALLFSHPDESFYLRQIIRMAGVATGAGQRELKWLSDTGIIKRMVRGNQVYYQANSECPVFTEIKSLMIKTVAVGDILRSALAPLAEHIVLALLYGSIARAAENKDSDVDVLVVGDVTFGEIVEKISPAQKILGREINPTVYPASELQKKLANGNHFLKSVLGDDMIFLIGNENELRRLVKERMAG